MEEVLSYPLTPIPLSLCHMESLKQTTSKVKFLHKLESCIPIDIPPDIDATLMHCSFYINKKQFLDYLEPYLVIF